MAQEWAEALAEAWAAEKVHLSAEASAGTLVATWETG